MTDLTDDELRAVAYYSIGVGSEGGDLSYQLSLAGNTIHERDGSVMLKPVGNSGYTIGTLQTDFGAHPNDAKDLVDAFQNWARANNHSDWMLSPKQQSQFASDLGRDGHHIRDANYDADNHKYMKENHGKHIPENLLPLTGTDIDPTFKAHLNEYLATDAGKNFIHQKDVAQVDKLIDRVALPLQKSDFYKNSSPEEQGKIFAATAKAFNQGDAYGNDILRDIRLNKINSLDDIKKKIDSFPHYMQQGRDAALSGAETFNTLSNASERNPMYEPWRSVVANPLVNPTLLGADPKQPHLADQYATVKALFVQPEQGRALVDALEKGGSHNYGDPSKSNSRGFYAEGKDFVQWDRNGQGRAFVGGEWSDFSRKDISLTPNKDRTLDVNITRNGETHSLLHVTHPIGHSHVASHAATHATGDTLHQGSHGEPVQKLQAQLGELGYLDNTATPDGKYGPTTRDAVKAYQHDHHLPEVGQAGPATQKAIQADLQALRQDNREASPAVSAVSDPAPKLSPPLDPPAMRDFRHAEHPLNARYQMFRDALGEQGFYEHRPTVNAMPEVRGYSAEQKDRLAAGFTAQLGADARFNAEIRHFDKDGGALLAVERPRHLDDKPLVLAIDKTQALARTPQEHAAAWRARELPAPQPVNTARPDPKSLSPDHPGHPDHPRHAMFEHARHALGTEYARWGIQKGADPMDRETLQVMIAAREQRMQHVGAIRLQKDSPDGRIGEYPKLAVYETAQGPQPRSGALPCFVESQALQQAPPVQQAAQHFQHVDQQATQQVQQMQQLQAQINAQGPQGPVLGGPGMGR